MTITDLIKAGRQRTLDNSKKYYTQFLINVRAIRDKISDRVASDYTKYLEGVDKENYLLEMNKNSRLDKLLDYVSTEIYDSSTQEDIEDIEKSGINQYYFMLYAMAWAGGTGQALDRGLADLIVYRDVNKPSVQRFLTGLTPQQRTFFRDRFAAQSKIPLSTTTNKYLGDMVTGINRHIELGIKQGKSYQQVVTGIRKEFGLYAGKVKRLTQEYAAINKATNLVKRIVGTDMHRISNATEYAAWEASGNEGRRFLIATLDGRTRAQSAQMDGQRENEFGFFEYPNGEQAAFPGDSGNPAYDVNDRESVGYDIDGIQPEQRSARNPVTGKTEQIEFASFNEWAKKNQDYFKKNKNGDLLNVYGQILLPSSQL